MSNKHRIASEQQQQQQVQPVSHPTVYRECCLPYPACINNPISSPSTIYLQATKPPPPHQPSQVNLTIALALAQKPKPKKDPHISAPPKTQQPDKSNLPRAPSQTPLTQPSKLPIPQSSSQPQQSRISISISIFFSPFFSSFSQKGPRNPKKITATVAYRKCTRPSCMRVAYSM